MSNVNNDDEIEIHNLPEVGTLQAGMMVAVDSQPTGTKCFNLTTALEGKANASDMNTALEGKVDSPATAPTTGQVLMFDGNDNVWSDPPKGVYVLNYTEVSDLNDIDINRVKTQPTFMKVDTDITVTIPTSGSSYTVSVQQGTIMAIYEIGSEGTTGSYTGPRFISFYCNNGLGVGGGIMQNADLKVLCMVSLSSFGGVTKAWGATGFLNSDGALLRTMPAPVTFKCANSRGPGSDSVTTNHALKVEIQSYGSIRKQSLLPAEIEDHDFSSDATPEQIQFMGWGATSNRAGYKTSLLATHSTRSSEYPPQTPAVAFNRYVMGSSETSDNVATSVNVEMISSVSGQGSAMFGGNLVPNLGSVGALQYWSDNNGAHYGFKPVNEVPASTSSNAGQVLTVAANGTPGWGNAIGFIKNVGALTDAATITASNLNNGFATLSTSQSALTIIDVVGPDEVVNFAIEITPSVNCTLTIQKKVGDNSPVTLKHSVAGGNTLEANKTYQVTAVGTCWTLAEFEA